MDEEKRDSTEGLYREYANNVYFDPSAWDLTVIFGQLSARMPEAGKPGIDWQSAVTLPWQQAKLMAYFLLVNIAIHEKEHGVVTIAPNLVPLAPNLQDATSETFRSIEGKLRRIHDEFFNEISPR